MLSRIWHEIWLTLFVGLIIVGVFVGEGLLIGFSAMGLLIVGAAWLWNRMSLDGVRYEREFSQRRLFIGEKASLAVTLTNPKPLPLGRLRAEDEIPASMDITDAEVVSSPNPEAKSLRHSTSMAWYERIRWRYDFTCNRRGYFRIGPTTLRSGDLFGFFSSERVVRGDDYVLVYPRVMPLPEIGMPAARPLGETRGGLRIFEDASRPMGLREYRSGDPLKIVDWKATARAQDIQVRTFEPSSAMTVMLAVAVDTVAHTWEGYSPRHLERIITAAASVASYADERGYSLGLFSNGTPVLADRPMRLAPSRSREQLTIVLEALASIRPLPVGTMAAQLGEHYRSFPMGATVVVALSLISETMPEALRAMRSRGYGVVVVYVGDEPPPPMPDGVIFHALGDAFEELEFADAARSRRWRRPRQDSGAVGSGQDSGANSDAAGGAGDNPNSDATAAPPPPSGNAP